MKAIGHLPELGGGLARLVRVRLDEQIEAAACRVGNLGWGRNAVLKFRFGGAAFDIGSDLGDDVLVGFLRGILVLLLRP